MKFALILLPFFLYLGAAGQGMGLYVFGLVVPLAWFLKNGVIDDITALRIRLIGRCLLGLHLTFVAANLLGRVFAPADWPEGALAATRETFRFYFESRFSSSFFVTGLFLSVFPKRASSQAPAAFDPFSLFVRSLAAATALISAYVLFQRYTGFDMRSPGHLLLPEHKISENVYRAFGFYGHPLSLSAVGLCYFTFAWWLWLVALKRSSAKLYKVRRELLFIALAGAGLVLAGGGRTALLVMLGIGAILGLRAHHAVVRKHIVAFLLSGLVAAGLAVYAVLPRFLDFLAKDGGAVALPDRVVFWKIHWALFLDRPLFGQGNAWLDAFRRTQFYNALGYESFRDKYNAHNVFLETLASTGVIGFLLVAFFGWKLKQELNKVLDASEELRAYSAAFGAAIVANLVHGFTQGTFFDTNVSTVYLGLLLAGVWSALVLRQHHREVMNVS